MAAFDEARGFVGKIFTSHGFLPSKKKGVPVPIVPSSNSMIYPPKKIDLGKECLCLRKWDTDWASLIVILLPKWINIQ